MNRNALFLFTIFERAKVDRTMNTVIDIDIHNWKINGSLAISSK
ncbi:hypothetical protein IWX83_002337 [Flavobacterium sp. CG_9.1]|nr:hypothetical protein [Flavobacterium sp. CG_9.1]MBG6062537.1 hypothetical protein [Flavobacterium sp. CG_9.1]